MHSLKTENWKSTAPHIVVNTKNNKTRSNRDGPQNELLREWESNFIDVEPKGEVLYPEILVHVDYEFYKHFGKDAGEVAKYMASFWNVVDLMYRQFDKPKIRLNIAGLVISQVIKPHKLDEK